MCQLRVLIKADLKPFNKMRNSAEINNTRAVTLHIEHSGVRRVRQEYLIDEDWDLVSSYLNDISLHC